MHSLADLNNFSDQSVTFTDERPYTLEFDRDVPLSSNIGFVEGNVIAVTPGVNLTKIINANVNSISYTVEVSDPNNITVAWSEIPTTMTLSANAQAGVYTVGNIMSLKDWNTVKSPVITPNKDYATNFTYSGTINYAQGNKSWVDQVTVTDTPEMTDPVDVTYTGNVSLTKLTAPLVVDTNTSQTYTLIVSGFIPGSNDATYVATPLVIQTNSTVGSVIVNDGTKVKVQGTKDQINTHLDNLYYQNTTGQTNNTFYWEYRLTSSTGLVTRKFQRMIGSVMTSNATTILYESGITSDYQAFDENTNFSLATYPTLTDYLSDQYGNLGNTGYSYVTTATTPSAVNVVATVSAGLTYNTWTTSSATRQIGVLYYPDGNAGNNTPFKTNAYANLRASLNSLTYIPPLDHKDYLLVRMSMRHYTGASQFETTEFSTQRILKFGNSVRKVSNIDEPRSFTQATVSTLFTTNIPQITDVSANTQVYTIQLTSSAGAFGLSDTNFSTSFTLTDTKANINAAFGNIKFYPEPGIAAGDYWFNYKQIREGVIQESRVVYFNCNARTQPIPGQGTFSLNTGTFSPTIYQRRYLKADILCVGGGGSGYASSVGYSSGGGGGGDVKEIFNVTTPDTAYTVALGSGGATSGFGQPGGTSYFGSLLSAAGGQQGGLAGIYKGGNSGSGFIGGQGSSSGGGGGGAGAGGNGFANTGTTGGNGGAGKLATFDNVIYGGGGAGSRYGSAYADGTSGTGANNAGGGGKGGQYTLGTTAGKTGIVLIRYHT